MSVGALISKGCSIPEDSIIGARAFVNSSFTEVGTIIAGSPAKVVKSGVTWHRGRKKKFGMAQLNEWRFDGLNRDDSVA